MAKDIHSRATELLNRINITTDIDEKEDFKHSFNRYLTVIDEIEDYQSILFHKNIAKLQRASYSHQTNNIDFLRNKLLIELDFKQKFVIGLSPRQVSGEYYNQIQRSCLGKFEKHQLNSTL